MMVHFLTALMVFTASPTQLFRAMYCAGMVATGDAPYKP